MLTEIGLVIREDHEVSGPGPDDLLASGAGVGLLA
jgi:hypothetical protein